MPKRRIRAAGYPRVSDPDLHDAPTIESQEKAIRAYCQKEGYDLTENHLYPEAMTAYMVSYTQRPQLMAILAAAKRHEFDVLVVTEIRAISRKQVEVFVIYDILQKYGVTIETITEKFEDSAIGRFILATRAMVAEIERENTYARTTRGKKDRLEGGSLPGHPNPAYGYVFLDTEREQKARYDFNSKVIFVDRDGGEWTPVKVVEYIFDLALHGNSLRGIAFQLNDLGVPPPQSARKLEPRWCSATIASILNNPVYMGKAYGNKWKAVGNKLLARPEEEWVLLPDGTVPAIVSQDVWQGVQIRLKTNKEEAMRNNKHPQDLGILRCGYCHCAICGRTMNIRHHNPTPTNDRRKPEYFCQTKTGGKGLIHYHNTVITQPVLDRLAWAKAVEVILNPAMVRARVEQLRSENVPQRNTEDIEQTIASIRRQMNNLYKLAQSATDDETIETITGMMKDLERQKHDAAALIYDIEEEEEDRQLVEVEITKFEYWAENVRPLLGNSTYEPTYEEKRLAVRILGLKASVYPAKGDFPFRVQFEVAPPAILAKIKNCVQVDQSRISCGQTECSTGKSGETL